MVLHMYSKLPEIHCTSADELNNFNESIKEKKCHIWALVYRYLIHCVIHCKNNSILSPLQWLFLLSYSGDAPALLVSTVICNIFQLFQFQSQLVQVCVCLREQIVSVTLLFIDRTAGSSSVIPESFVILCWWKKERMRKKNDICTMSLTLQLVSRAQERSLLLTLLTWSSW